MRDRFFLSFVAVLGVVAVVVVSFAVVVRQSSGPTIIDPAAAAAVRATAEQQAVRSTTPRAAASVAAAALGDSVVYGSGTWYRLVTNDKGRSGVFDVRTSALPGERTARIKAELPATLAARPTVVFVCGGTDDMLNAVPVPVTIGNMREMALGVRGGGAKPILSTVPPSDELPYRVGPLNAAIRALGAELGAPVVDPWGRSPPPTASTHRVARATAASPTTRPASSPREPPSPSCRASSRRWPVRECR